MFDVVHAMKLEPFMQFNARVPRRSFVLGFLALFAAASVPLFAQAPNSPIVFQSPSAITVSLVECPQLGRTAGGGGSSSNTQWLLVEWHYQVIPKAPLPYVDSVEFRVWVEGRDLYAPEATTADGLPIALTGSVTYINLPETRDGYGSVYIHPSTLVRYSTKSGPSDFTDKFNVHVEAYVGGAKMDLFDLNKPQDPNWYQNLKAVPNLLYRQDQSPFIADDVSRYPQLKPLPTPQ